MPCGALVFARSSLDDGGWALSREPGGGADGDGALVAGRRWRHVRFLERNEVPVLTWLTQLEQVVGCRVMAIRL